MKPTTAMINHCLMVVKQDSHIPQQAEKVEACKASLIKWGVYENQAPRLVKDIFYWPSYVLARGHLEKLKAWQDADACARVNSFGKGHAIQERRSGRYWGMVAHNCPQGGTFEAEGWV